MTLLAIYSAGLGIPFLIVAAFTDRLTGRLRGVGRLGRRLHQGRRGDDSYGIAMITGQLSALSYWLLDVFPVLGQIGERAPSYASEFGKGRLSAMTDGNHRQVHKEEC
ncbi:hypothetical protein ACLGGT_21535 [Roseovarius sp. MS2]